MSIFEEYQGETRHIDGFDVETIRHTDPIREAIRLASLGDIASALAVAKGEQPDSTALPDAGALRGDAPLSSSDKEIK